MDKETLRLNASEILQYGSLLENTITRLRIINGCSDTDISFVNDVVTGYDHTPEADDECKVFHPDGGGLTWKTNPGAGTYRFNGNNRIMFDY